MTQQTPRTQTRILINLGCGPAVKRSRWQDFDGSWNVLASHLPLGLGWIGRKLLGHSGAEFPAHVRYVNVTKRLPFADASADAVYFSHVLEHLHLDDGLHLLAETYRVLKPGGWVRVLVPDLEHFARTYVQSSNEGNVEACFELNKILMYRPLSVEKGTLRRVYTALTDFHSHKFMYDRHYLGKLLGDAGFSEIGQKGFCESSIPEVADIETEERIVPGIGFGLEARRPG